MATEEKKLKNIPVHEDLHEEVKKRATEIGLTITEFAEFALTKLLKKGNASS